MITSVRLTSGRSTAAAPLIFDPRPITVFVGPNNSGKSLTLREIEGWCKLGPQQEPRNIVAEIEAELPDGEQALAELEPFKLRRFSSGQVVPEGYLALKRPDPHQEGVQEQSLHVQSFLQQWHAWDWTYISQFYLAFFTLRLDGRTRFSLTQPRSSGDLQVLPQNHLIALFKDDKARRRIRSIVADAFGLYFVVDPTAMTQFRIKMSEREPSDAAEEQALDERARLFRERLRTSSNSATACKLSRASSRRYSVPITRWC